MHFLLFFCMILSVSKCEQWFKYDSYEYYFGSEVGNFESAMAKCSAKNSSLVIIRNPKIQLFLKSTFVKIYNRSDYYIGLKRINDTKYGFEWIDETPVSSSFMDWGVGEPNNCNLVIFNCQPENCVFMWEYKDYKWNDAPCNYMARYICQRKAANSSNSKSLLIQEYSTKNVISTFGKSLIYESTTERNFTQIIYATKNLEQKPKMYLPMYLILILVVVVLMMISISIVLIIRRKELKVIAGNSFSGQHATNEMQLENDHQAPNSTCSLKFARDQSSTYLQPIKYCDILKVESAYASISEAPNALLNCDRYINLPRGIQETCYENVVKTKVPYVNVSEATDLPQDDDGYVIMAVGAQSNASKQL